MSLSEKPFDIVVSGASGYTGRLLAEYLAAECAGSDLKLAMAGRSLDKLAAVRAEMGISDTIELLAVDVGNPDSVTQMVDAAGSSLPPSDPTSFMVTNWSSNVLSAAPPMWI